MSDSSQWAILETVLRCLYSYEKLLRLDTTIFPIVYCRFHVTQNNRHLLYLQMLYVKYNLCIYKNVKYYIVYIYIEDKDMD